MPRGLVAGFILVSICVVIHTTGMLLIAGLIDVDRVLEEHTRIRRYSFLLSLVFTMITLLHLMEIVIWAVAFKVMGLLPKFENAVYFSLGNYTTNGSGGVALPEEWRLLGGLESILGMLLCGLSTAFLFSIVLHMFKVRSRRRSSGAPTTD